MSNGRIILNKILLVFLITVAILTAFLFLREEYLKSKNKKFYTNIQKILEDEEIELFVNMDSNIYFKIKNEIIEDYKCLNDKCTDLLKSIGYDKDKIVKNNIKEIINTMYNNEKQMKNYNVNTINLLSSNSKIELLSYKMENSKYVNLSLEEENNLFKENKIERINKEDYNKKLLDELKKDRDFGKYYNCDIYDYEVRCYITDFMDKVLKDLDKQNGIKRRYNEFSTLSIKFKRQLNKFNFNYKSIGFMLDSITLGDNKEYSYTNYYNLDILNQEDKSIREKKNLNNVLYKEDDVLYLIPFSKVNLLTKTVNINDVIMAD